MSYNVLYTENFRKEAKPLAKKYTSLKTDIEALIGSLRKIRRRKGDNLRVD